MGAFDDAVLDANLRVRGMDVLRVIDGSIIPTMVSAKTNGPIMAAGWRAAELIAQGATVRRRLFKETAILHKRPPL
jgi:choline dehydrogenase